MSCPLKLTTVGRSIEQFTHSFTVHSFADRSLIHSTVCLTNSGPLQPVPMPRTIPPTRRGVNPRFLPVCKFTQPQHQSQLPENHHLTTHRAGHAPDEKQSQLNAVAPMFIFCTDHGRMPIFRPVALTARPVMSIANPGEAIRSSYSSHASSFIMMHHKRLQQLACLVAPLLIAGCNTISIPQQASPSNHSSSRHAMFEPIALRLHPTFSRITDWTDDNKPDGIEVLAELRDDFGDPTKAAGRFVFELFAYDRDSPTRRGKRIENAWIAPVETREQQRERWSFASRCYVFRLESPRIKPGNAYLLSATFDGSTRLFSELIIQPPSSN